jgi:Lon protease-like protein
MPINLRIFEERYKLMISECIEQREPFGVVLIRSGAEVTGLGADAIPYAVGCTAHITQVQPLIAGQMNIVAVGRDRFQIVRLETEQPYLVGQVEMLPFSNDAPDETARAGRRLRPWVEKYLNLLGAAENVQFDMNQLPYDPLLLAYLSASLIKVALTEKQELLTTDSALTLIHRVHRYYRKEVTLLNALMGEVSNIDQGPFSLN